MGEYDVYVCFRNVDEATRLRREIDEAQQHLQSIPEVALLLEHFRELQAMHRDVDGMHETDTSPTTNHLANDDQGNTRDHTEGFIDNDDMDIAIGGPEGFIDNDDMDIASGSPDGFNDNDDQGDIREHPEGFKDNDGMDITSHCSEGLVDNDNQKDLTDADSFIQDDEMYDSSESALSADMAESGDETDDEIGNKPISLASELADLIPSPRASKKQTLPLKVMTNGYQLRSATRSSAPRSGHPEQYTHKQGLRSETRATISEKGNSPSSSTPSRKILTPRGAKKNVGSDRLGELLQRRRQVHKAIDVTRKSHDIQQSPKSQKRPAENSVSTPIKKSDNARSSRLQELLRASRLSRQYNAGLVAAASDNLDTDDAIRQLPTPDSKHDESPLARSRPVIIDDNDEDEYDESETPNRRKNGRFIYSGRIFDSSS